MSEETFRALLLEQSAGGVQASLRDLPRSALPEGDVLVAIAYSDLNYKDGLALTGQGRVVRAYPMVPGIDFAGTVVESRSAAYQPGDAVVLTGWGAGEWHWGGYATMARVKADWLVPLPAGLSLQQAMAIGTAGFTAMLCVMALEEHGLQSVTREVLVTGAAGGVGSIAVALLANLGYNVTASTGRAEAHGYLRELGARQFVDRAELTAPGKPLESERWGASVDTVGGDVLAGVLRAMAANTSVAACGNAGGAALNTTVFPFILRGVNLLGINSVAVPTERRIAAWERLARDLPAAALDRMTRVVPLAAVPGLAGEILAGRVQGRVVIDVNA
jgi:acrylyl-CoA reductase (NADPH)